MFFLKLNLRVVRNGCSIFPTKIRENKNNKEDSILMVPESSNQNILEKQIKANAIDTWSRIWCLLGL
jgi:hypothetical protein